jgi:sulfide:quinone oxidoreductase
VKSVLKAVAMQFTRKFASLPPLKHVINPNHSRIALVGCGLSGVIASHYLKRFGFLRNQHIRIFDSSPFHIFSPLLSHYVFGHRERDELESPMLSLINDFTEVEFAKVISIDATKNQLTTHLNRAFEYDVLILAPGLVPTYDHITREEAEDLDNAVICLTGVDAVPKAKRHLEFYNGGDVIFYTAGITKVKDPIAALNTALLFQAKMSKLLKKSGGKLIYMTEDTKLSPFPACDAALTALLKERNFEVITGAKLQKVDGIARNLRVTAGKDVDSHTEYQFELMFLEQEAAISDVFRDFAGGGKTRARLNVDMETLQHVKYENVFGVGHATPTPTLHSLEGIYAQSLVLAANIGISFTEQIDSVAKIHKNQKIKYDGYTRFPLWIGSNRVQSMEFDAKALQNIMKPSLKEYLMETVTIPKAYYSWLSSGWWYGRRQGSRRPDFMKCFDDAGTAASQAK